MPGPDRKIQPFGIAALPASMTSAVPFTLYDPEMMAKWAEDVWTLASDTGSADSLGATWTPDVVNKAHRITYDAHCVMPQTIPFDADNDDLFKDSMRLETSLWPLPGLRLL